MEMARQIPGVFPAAFEVDGTIIDTVPIRSSANRVLRQAWNPENSQQHDLGTHDFVVIVHCCAYSHFHGFGGAGDIPSVSKFAGFGIIQTSSLN
jgi:hypothetical protein